MLVSLKFKVEALKLKRETLSELRKMLLEYLKVVNDSRQGYEHTVSVGHTRQYMRLAAVQNQTNDLKLLAFLKPILADFLAPYKIPTYHVNEIQKFSFPTK